MRFFYCGKVIGQSLISILPSVFPMSRNPSSFANKFPDLPVILGAEFQ
jgi:hypothetical protein